MQWYITLLLLSLPLQTPLSSPDHTSLTSGQSQYQQLSLKASLPKYGPCWLSALSMLTTTCSHLSDTTQARLALQFTNCFLAQAGQKQYPCKEEEEIASCLEDVDNNAFTAYSNFYTHTQNMCYFIKSQEWQEIQDNTINKLSYSSAKVAREMEESHDLQKEIALAQQDSLQYQRQLAEKGTFLSQAIETSKGNVKDMLEEFRSSTNEQKNLIFEVFDRVSRLQNLVVSEVSWLYTVVFYSACLLVIYLVTATKRTADSRLCMFFILTANFGLERLVISWSLPEDGDSVAMDLSQMVSERIWMVRKMAIFISFVVLAFMAIRFKDINLVNNSLLEEIKRQNLELKMSMENFQAVSKTSQDIPRGHHDCVDTLDGHFTPLSDMLAEDTGFNGDEEDFSDTDSDSFDANKTDRTFDPHSLDMSLSDDQYGTAANTRETTPTNLTINTIDKAMEALTSTLVHSTPAKSTKQRSRPSSPMSDVSRYNLRSRRSGSTANQTLQETPETFTKLVKEQMGRSKRNFSKWKLAVGRQGGSDSDN